MTVTPSNNWSLWSNIITAILCVGLVGFFGPKVSRWYKRYKFFRSLPTPPYSYLFGNLHVMPLGGDERLKWMEQIMKEIHPKFIAFWITPVFPLLIVYDPELLKTIFLSSAAPKSRGFGAVYEFAIPWIGEGLVTANGERWARSRKLLNPAFHSNILKNYMSIYNQCANKLIKKLDALAETGESFDLFPLITKCTLEIMMKCILGYDADVQNYKDGYHPYAHAVLELSEIWMKRFRRPYLWLDCIFYRTAMGKDFHKHCVFMHKIADDIIEERRKVLEKGDTPQGKHMDFLDMLLSARDEDGQPMTSLEIRSQVDTFMFAGHDTTSTSLTFNLYNLAKHQEYQRKVQQEVDGILEGRESDDMLWEDLSQLKMLALCQKENLRVYSPVPTIGRILTKDMKLDDITVPSGTMVSMSIQTVHLNPAFWDKPLEYIPERFLSEEMDKYAFVPFSAGPRNCIGQIFSGNEERAISSRILRRFDLHLATDHEPPQRKLSAILKTENGIWLTAKRRNGVSDH